jgi:hypothetical protein
MLILSRVINTFTNICQVMRWNLNRRLCLFFSDDGIEAGWEKGSPPIQTKLGSFRGTARKIMLMNSATSAMRRQAGMLPSDSSLSLTDWIGLDLTDRSSCLYFSHFHYSQF